MKKAAGRAWGDSLRLHVGTGAAPPPSHAPCCSRGLAIGRPRKKYDIRGAEPKIMKKGLI